jgi:putative DNA primase/helicase
MAFLASIAPSIKEKADSDRFSQLMLAGGSNGSATQRRAWEETCARLSRLKEDATVSQRLLSRALTYFPLIKQNIATFLPAAASKFGSPRHGDQYGTLLAGWWSLQHDEPATVEDAERVLKDFGWADVIQEHDEKDGEKCLRTICEAMLQGTGGERYSVRTLISRALDRAVEGVFIEPTRARRLLGDHGINTTREGLVAFACGHTNLAKLLQNTKFSGKAKHYLAEIKGAESLTPRRFNESMLRSVGIPFGAFGLDDDGEGSPL